MMVEAPDAADAVPLESSVGDEQGYGEEFETEEGILGIEEEEECGDACCDEEDPFSQKESSTALKPSSSGASSPARKRQRSQRTGSRLEELAKPKPVLQEPEPPTLPAIPREQKKKQKNRPSLLLRLRPTNLEESWEAFSASGFQEAPRFTYAYSEDVVAKHFEENSNVCFELLPEAKRILQRVQDEYGGSETFMKQLYGERKIPAEELRDIVADYLKDHNIEDKVEIRLVDNMLAAANVTKPGADEKYVVNIANGPISWNMVQGICDHEVGTHLLRMMNDEHQVWHGSRDRYKLANPWTTEEGFATLNTYQSMPCRLMYPQALRYYAVCRGAQCGFVELFNELREHTSDPKRCWQMCCRIKRGMVDTSLPGAFYMDQAYFKGAVEILRHLNEVDFGRLYGGQIALQDLDKVHFLLRKEVVRLPRFLNSADTLKTYIAHCRRLIKENQIEAAVEKVCKPVFIRTAREFFKPPKQKMNATIAIGELDVSGKDARSASVGASRPMDAERLADLARPRQALATTLQTETAPAAKTRDFDRNRVFELSLPRRRVEPEAEKEPRCSSIPRSCNLARLEDLAKPRQLSIEYISDCNDQKRDERRGLDSKRLFELAMPRRVVESESTSNDPPDAGDSVPPPPKPLDVARLAELAAPRKQCEDKTVPCKCPRKSGRRKRRSKCRILAMVQERNEVADETIDEENGMESDIEQNEQLTLEHADSLDNFVNAHNIRAEEEILLNSLSVDRPQSNAAAEPMIMNITHQAVTTVIERSPYPPHLPTSQEQTRSNARPDHKPRSRAVARARSLGAGAGFDASEMRHNQAGMANGIGGRSALPFADVALGGIARHQRWIAAVNGTSAAAVLGAGGVGSLWKPVPVKVMQFDFCL
mmetsp:Transcript_116275/g.183847  ORF Transcript_116275/g.183847 Transcript_116275/m.183847 type:complete len:880 (-) Transcript_116275:173-2812(-)